MNLYDNNERVFYLLNDGTIIDVGTFDMTNSDEAWEEIFYKAHKMAEKENASPVLSLLREDIWNLCQWMTEADNKVNEETGGDSCSINFTLFKEDGEFDDFKKLIADNPNSEVLNRLKRSLPSWFVKSTGIEIPKIEDLDEEN